MRRLFLIVLFTGLAVVTFAQRNVVPKDTSKKIIIDNTDRLRGDIIDKVPVRFFVGNVRLHQGNVRVECDSATLDNFNNVRAFGNVLIQQADTVNIFADSLYYNGNQRTAELLGEIVLTDSKAELFTDRLDYDLNTKIATYQNGAIIKNAETRLYSQKGYYYVEKKEAFFKDSVVVSDPQYALKADTLKINTETNVTYFLGPTNVVDKENQIYAEKGFYDAQNEYAEFEKNAKFRSLVGDRRATALKIRYNGKIKTTYLEGDAFFKDSTRTINADTIAYNSKRDEYRTFGKTAIKDGNQTITSDGAAKYDAILKVAIFTKNVRIANPPQFLTADSVHYDQDTHWGEAFGNVFWEDTAENVTIQCLQADFNDSTKAVFATGRPLMTTIVDEDTLYLAAEYLRSYLEYPEDTTSRIVNAVKKVKIYKSDLQALCDSLIYTQKDSLFSLHIKPIVWSDTSQFTADTVRIQLANQSIDQIFLLNKAFIINSPDERFFNQIKGRDVLAKFIAGELRKMQVLGNGESIYYVLDEAKAYVGVNQTICSEMLLYFGNNEITDIRFFNKPKGNFTPMKQVKENTFRLEGFRWVTTGRPQSVKDLR